MWRSQHQSLLWGVYRFYRWREVNGNKLYHVLVTPGLLLGVKSRQGSLGVVFLTWYAGPTVGGWGRFSPTCIWSRVYYRVPDSALVFSREVRWSVHLCVPFSWLWSIIPSGCYEHYTVTVCFWVPPVSLAICWLIYRLYTGYLVPCVGQRFGMFPFCILVLVIVSGVWHVLHAQRGWHSLKFLKKIQSVHTKDPVTCNSSIIHFCICFIYIMKLHCFLYIWTK